MLHGRNCAGKKWLSRKISLGIQEVARPPGRVKGQGPLVGVRGQCPMKLLNLQDFKSILKLLLAAFTVNLQRERKKINAFNHSINNK